MSDHKSKKKHKSSSKHKHKETSEIEWVEAPAPKIADVKGSFSQNVEVKKAGTQRDDWMNEEMFVGTLSKDEMKSGSSRHRKLEAQALRKEKEDEIQKKRELNPHWKNNGTGLPRAEQTTESLSLPSTSVGDGGYSFLKKAYYRIKIQSQQEGRSMEDIAVERWGSLEKLTSMIEEAEDRMKQNSKNKYNSEKSRHRDQYEQKSSTHYRRPSTEKKSPSHSPERTFKFEKPKHISRKDRKLGHYSSSDRKRSERTDTTQLDILSKHERYDYIEESSESDISNTPAWKKVKLPQDRIDIIEQERVKDIFVWEKESTAHEEKEKLVGKCANVPAWKKHKQSHASGSSQNYKVCRSSKSMSPEKVNKEHHKKLTSTSNDFPSITSEDDLNKLAARCTKAELLGDTALASKLKQQLEEAREMLKSGTNTQSFQERGKERVMLTKTDSSGQERPIYYTDDVAESQSRQKKKQSQKFYDDGGRYSLKQMFEREKLITTDDNIEMFMEVAGQCKDKDDENETSGISKKATNKMAHHLQEEKDVGKAIRQHQKRNTALEKCNYCLDQPNMKRHLIVYKSKEVYLCIPDFQSLIEGHCLIVPKRHVSSFLLLEEEEWEEVEDLKCSLRKMFLKQNKNIITLETCRSFKYYPHAFLEIIPVPEEISDMAPLYFKKAILESETEWANNVKLIDLSKKSLRRSVPKNLPYFCVQFDPKIHAGYAHVIEDEKHFERNFGKEVVGGMLDIDYNYLYKNRKEDPTKKSQETLKFMKMWENFTEDST